MNARDESKTQDARRKICDVIMSVENVSIRASIVVVLDMNRILRGDSKGDTLYIYEIECNHHVER